MSATVVPSMKSVRRDRQLGTAWRPEHVPLCFALDDALAALRQGICPYCARGPFTVVAIHIAQVHLVGTRELRDLFHLRLNESICDPTHSAAAASLVREAIAEGRRPPPPSRTGQASYVRRAGIRPLPRGDASCARARQARLRRLAAERAPRDAPVVLLFRAGLSVDAIADRLGYATGRPVADVLRRYGVTLDMRPSAHIRRRSGPMRTRKLTADAVRVIRARRRAGEQGTTIAAEYGISSGLVGHIMSGRAWAHISDEVVS